MAEEPRSRAAARLSGGTLDRSASFVPFPRSVVEQSLGQRFEEQAAIHADRPAVKSRRRAVTYRELNHMANRIAHALGEECLPEDEPVALLLDKDAPLIAAMLGVLKRGRTFVPLDPCYPRGRTSFMLDDTGCSLILTDRQNHALAGALAGTARRALNVEALDGCRRAENPKIPVPPGTPSYILYTSGSTGQAKGVVQSHRCVLHNVMKYTSGFHLNAEDRLTLLFSASFGEALNDIFCALLNGAALLPWDPQADGIGGLPGWLASEQLTVFHSVPTLFREFAQLLPNQAQLPHLRIINLGGESVTRRDVELFRQHFSPACFLVNSLGSTEAKLICQYYVDRETEITGPVLPVGYEAEDTQVLLLDDEGREVGANQVGEIYVRSRYLSLGYWRQGELTACRFLPDPQDPQARLYRTGDLGRMNPDRLLEHLGRRDDQVKLRGYRIEPQEIEATLGQYPAARHCAIMLREDIPGDKRLVAYVVPQPGQKPTASELRLFLGERLPDYLVPSSFVMLEALPLTPTGKVDRGALPGPGHARPELERSFVAPQDPLECRLAKIWEELLGIRPIGTRDSFFDLGGHSLLAARLFARIESAFGRRLPLATLLQASTVEQLAGLLRQKGEAGSWSSLVPLQAGGSRPPFFCVHGVGGNVVGYRDLVRHLGPDQPFYGLQTPGLDGTPFRAASVEGIADRYLQTIRGVQPDGPYFLGGYSFGGTVAYEMARRLLAQGQEVALLALLDTDGPGHPRYFPLPWRLGCHLRNLARLGWKDKLTYLRVRARAVAELSERCFWRLSPRPYRRLAASSPHLHRMVWIAHSQALREYLPEPYPGRVTLFRAEQRPVGSYPDPGLGWDELAAGGLEVHTVPGDHITLLEEPHVRVLAEQLRACLKNAPREA